MILLIGWALAQDDEAPETITSGAVAPVAVPVAPTGSGGAASVALAASALKLEPAFVQGVRDAVYRVYARDNKGARAAFEALEASYPGRGAKNAGISFIMQGLMMENFDFKYEKEWRMYHDYALKDIDAALKVPGREAWEHFIAGALLGVESIHMMRREEWMGAVTKGLEAVGHVDKVKELAPAFKDPLLGDGLYDYWRSVVTLDNPALPDFEDKRALGIQEMMTAEREAVFLGPAASLGLAFTWIEERQYGKALESCLVNQRAFPNNVVNNLVLSRVYMYLRRYEDSLRTLDRVLATAPDNQRVHYYYGTIYYRQGKLDKADASLDKYLSFKQLEPYQRAQAMHRKGDVAYKRKDYAKAASWYEQAVKVGNYKPSKDALARMKKSGKIQ